MYENNLIKAQEVAWSGPMRFPKSIYFIYFPLTPEIEQTLNDKCGGSAILGGNPAAINRVIYAGNDARESVKGFGSSIDSFMEGLSQDQLEELKQKLGVDNHE
jgi:hypothetical protein